MSVKTDQRIKISRSAYIEESRPIALIRLNEKHFLKGELVMLNYYKEKDHFNNIGVLVALGIKDGIGSDCYKILNTGALVPVVEVTDSLPDVSKLVHGEVYLVELDGVWNYVYQKPGSPNRTIDEVTGGPHIFLELSSGYRWFYSDQKIKREDDFIDTESLLEIINSVTSLSGGGVKVSCQEGYLFKIGDVVDLTLDLQAVDIEGNDISDSCNFYIDGIGVIRDEEGTVKIRNVNKDHTYRVTAKFQVAPGVYVPYSTLMTIKFGRTFFYGRVKEGWNFDIEGLEYRKLGYRHDFLWDKIVMDLDSLAISYPKEYGHISHIYDENGIEYIHDYQAYDLGTVIDGVPYIVYVKKDYVSLPSFKQTYSFENTESLEVEEQNILDIVSAWKSGKIVVLGEDGKIDESLYNPDPSATFKEIKEFVTSNPSSGMTPNDLYFNITDKTLFLAISDLEGMVIAPTPGQIYIYEGEYYSWNGTEFSSFSRAHFEKINIVTEASWLI